MSEKPFGLAAKALVADDHGRVLLVRRSADSKHYRHKWDLPGGKVDPGESFDAALHREVEEEAGLRVTIEGVAGAAEHEMPSVRAVILVLEARRVAGEVRLSDEHDAYRWVSRSEICSLDLSDELRPFLSTYCGQ